MLDPSVFLTKEIFITLKDRKNVFVPYSLAKINIELQELLNYFSWYKRKLEDKDLEYIKKILEEIEPYKANPIYRKEFEEITSKIEFKVNDLVKKIIIEEYSFLREHSFLLLRTKKTISYFKKFGIATLDTGNSLIKKKKELFQRFEIIRYGLRIYVAILLLFNPPLWISVPNLILAFSDP